VLRRVVSTKAALRGCALGVVALVASAQPAFAQSTALDLWKQGKVAFGVFVPSADPAPRSAVYTEAVGEALAANPLYDFAFLNLEPRYDAAAIKAVVQGIRKGNGPRKTLIVRIPTIEKDGAEAAKARIAEAFALGADGVTLPHVRSVDEAKQALGFFREAKVNIWSSGNPKGDRIAMLMIEDAGALAQAREIADLGGYSVLACGIGSLTQALGGNREAAEAGNQKILAETKRTKLVNMLTTSTRDVEQRVGQGFLALIAQGQNADEAITLGRKAAQR
jgi:2-keto-3-deoxy-L-rhamnonate aldolase RhmA